VLLLCGGRELPARDLISTDDHKDYIYLHREHGDWVTKVEWIPEIGLVTSSLDTTIKVCWVMLLLGWAGVREC